VKRRKFILGSSAALVSASFVASAGAFSSTETERDVQIEIAGDKNAYLSLDDGESSEMLFDSGAVGAPGEFTIKNQGTKTVEITVEIQNSDANDQGCDLKFETGGSNKKLELTLGSGAKSVVKIKFSGTCANNGTGDGSLSFEVTDTDDELQIDTQRDLTLKNSTST